MIVEKVDTLVVGGGQAGLAMSAHLGRRGLSHVVLERARIAERWRSARWDSLVANGPAWHDRFPILGFDECDPASFVGKERIADYFVEVAKQIEAPIRCGVEVLSVEQQENGVFRAETSAGVFEAKNIVAATGPFQRPLIPQIVPEGAEIFQVHSFGYRNPAQLPDGAVMVVGAGASGSQIADELLRAGKKVYLSVGPHDRPPIRYRGRDFCWWLGVLGLWDAKARTPGTEHITIAVSGAHGGKTVDFREFAARGMTLVGRAGSFADGVMRFNGDLQANIAGGDANYLSVLQMADDYALANGLEMPLEPEAHQIGPMPDSAINPLRELDFAKAGITAIVWATGYALDYSWLKVPAFDATGKPVHDKGVSRVRGVYFLGLPWLTRRASPFIWGVWKDADDLAELIAEKG
jgi:putative flavoprotein involved in K+ transport